jgi:hypothetical protein
MAMTAWAAKFCANEICVSHRYNKKCANAGNLDPRDRQWAAFEIGSIRTKVGNVDGFAGPGDPRQRLFCRAKVTPFVEPRSMVTCLRPIPSNLKRRSDRRKRSSSTVITEARRISDRSAALVLSSPPKSLRCCAMISLQRLTHPLRPSTRGIVPNRS